VARKIETQKLQPEPNLEKKKVILAALAKASEDSSFPQDNAAAKNGDSQNYYTLSRSEMTALVSGDMGIIESWISNLDRYHATRLLRYLIKESW
jgi:hypothetical protein